MVKQERSGGAALTRVIAHVELVSDAERRAKTQLFRQSGHFGAEELGRIERSILDPDKYEMIVTLTVLVDDGSRVTGPGFGFGGPRRGTGAIWHRYRGPQLSEDPVENDQLLDETYHVGLPDIEDAINQALGRDPTQHRPPVLSWSDLLDALADAGVETTEEELIALPLSIELSERVEAELGGM